MGVNLCMEDETGTTLESVLDPQNLVGCILSLADLQNTVCLRFIDPYGDVVFNHLQTPFLIGELEAVRSLVTDERVGELGSRRLKSAVQAEWAPTLIQEIESENRRRTTSDILAHLERLLELARRSQRERHTYLKWYGD